MTTTPCTDRAARVIARCREIASYSEVQGETTRTFLSAPMKAVHALLRGWMEAAGMQVRVDAVGNLRGIWAGLSPQAPILIIGSHLDTVPNAGSFDGILGVVMGVAIIEELRGKHLPFAIEVIGFSEEEGVRFRRPFLGSLAIVGQLDANLLSLKDGQGVTVAEAIDHFGLNPNALADALLTPGSSAYLEFHIEQGPVLESEGLQVGIVDGVVGQSRMNLYFVGAANHAGTTPMHLRKDAMAAAAEWIVALESVAAKLDGAVATVGSVQTRPGAGNTIAGEVVATLDLRHADDTLRRLILDRVLDSARLAASRRGVKITWEQLIDQPAVPLDLAMTTMLDDATRSIGKPPRHLVSGAGHDAMIIAPHIPSCMLFLRSPGGISHHPSESVFQEDVEVALEITFAFLSRLQLPLIRAGAAEGINE